MDVILKFGDATRFDETFWTTLSNILERTHFAYVKTSHLWPRSRLYSDPAPGVLCSRHIAIPWLFLDLAVDKWAGYVWNVEGMTHTLGCHAGLYSRLQLLRTTWLWLKFGFPAQAHRWSWSGDDRRWRLCRPVLGSYMRWTSNFIVPTRIRLYFADLVDDIWIFVVRSLDSTPPFKTTHHNLPMSNIVNCSAVSAFDYVIHVPRNHPRKLYWCGGDIVEIKQAQR